MDQNQDSSIGSTVRYHRAYRSHKFFRHVDPKYLCTRGHNALSLPVDVMCIWRRHLGKAPLLVQLNGSDARKYTKKIIARLLVDVETQIISHFKPQEELYPTKN